MCTYANALRFFAAYFFTALLGTFVLGGVNYAKTGQFFAAAKAAAAPSVITLTSQDNGLVHIVPAGSVVEIELPQDLSSGIAWRFKQLSTHGIALQSETNHAANGDYEVRLKTGQSGSATVILVKQQGHGKPVETFMVDLVIHAPPATEQEAAHLFAEMERQASCEGFGEHQGQVDHVFMQRPYVLADWSCGLWHGEIAFQMQGMAERYGTTSIVGTRQFETRLDATHLKSLGMDAATAKQLLDKRDQLSR